jgi:hypothetical protein
MTNPRRAALMTTDRAGPLHVRGLRPAVESLKWVVADIQSEVPEILTALGTMCDALKKNSPNGAYLQLADARSFESLNGLTWLSAEI